MPYSQKYIEKLELNSKHNIAAIKQKNAVIGEKIVTRT
jgi:hypothetical protein